VHICIKDATEKRPTSVFQRAFIANPETARKSLFKEKFSAAGNKRARGTVVSLAASVAFETKEDQPMTIRTRITLGVSVAALSLSLALAPAAFAQDKMGKDDGMKKDTMSKDTMSKDTMKKDTMSKDAMKKDDGMNKDGMKKGDAMKKN
jgi:pentapeptide MXKDX repeat protein